MERRGGEDRTDKDGKKGTGEGRDKIDGKQGVNVGVKDGLVEKGGR